MPNCSLLLVFSERLGREPDAKTASALEGRLRQIWGGCGTAWPGISLPADEFFGWIAGKLASQPDPFSGLDELHATDLYLAYACSLGNVRALSEFDRRFLAEVPSYVSKIDSSRAFADEVRQQLRRKLFVIEEGSAAKIADYSGRGELGAWLRVAAVRTARNIIRTVKPSVPVEDVPLQANSADPELNYFKARYTREFRQAFEGTLESLEPRERNILRLYFVEGMSSIAIAKLYEVKGATVRLWLKKWRESILNDTRERLGARLKLNSADLDSVMGLVVSRFDLSISRLLKRRPSDPSH